MMDAPRTRLLSRQQRVAYIRATVQAIGTALLVILTSYQLHGGWEPALIAGGIAALSALGIRGVAEGAVDTARARDARAPYE